MTHSRAGSLPVSTTADGAREGSDIDSWSVLGPAALAAAGLLVLAGAPKILDPGDLVRALRSVGLRVPPLLVRLFALTEVVAGLTAIALPGPAPFAAVALLHAGFTVFVLVALTRGGVIASCGCFGRADTPPTRAHAAVTGLLALASGALAVTGPPDAWWDAGVAPALATALLAGLVGFLAWQVMAALPATTPAAIRSTRRT